MTDLHQMFLAQSYRDAYDFYRQSLEGERARPGWDYVILTASNEAQAASYRRQIDYRLERGMLPKETHYAVLPDPDGAESYPITSYTWMIFRKANGDPAKVKAIHEMIEYGLTEGQKVADSMGYIPLPAVVVEQVRKAAANIK